MSLSLPVLLAVALGAASPDETVTGSPPLPPSGDDPPPASPAPAFGFDRLDLLSEDTGAWLNHELPRLGVTARAGSLRFLTQLKPVFTLPYRGLYAGLSISSQSLVYEHPLKREWGLYATGGLQTRLLFPRGVLAGVAWRHGYLRLGLSLSAFTGGSWAAPGDFTWTFLPSLGIGVGPAR